MAQPDRGVLAIAAIALATAATAAGLQQLMLQRRPPLDAQDRLEQDLLVFSNGIRTDELRGWSSQHAAGRLYQMRNTNRCARKK